MFRSFIIAISTYSKIPTPQFEWKEKDMKYSMCFFPFVGAIISLLCFGAYYIFEKFHIGQILQAAVYTSLPILVTGGIHMDGFIDTVDAKSSYSDKERKLEILKDPHVGAFAIIYACVYFLLWFGLCTEILNAKLFVAVLFIFPLSRIFSALSVIFFKKAKKDGMVSSFADAASEKKTAVKVILIAELLLYIALMCCVSFYMSLHICIAMMLLAAVICFVYYRVMSYKTFGGVTGDLAGYFLQICELGMLVAIVIYSVMI